MKIVPPSGRMKAQEQRAFAGMRGDKFLHLHHVVRLQVRHLQAQVNLPGVFLRRVGQRHDVLRENLGPVLAGADFADDEMALFSSSSGRNLS